MVASPVLRDAASSGALPRFHTSFIGRERECAELLALLERSRLTTLMGVGGIGKTRLAVEVAREWLDTHPADAWFVDLSLATEEQGIAAALAQAILPDSASSPAPLEAAGTVLAQGSSLLVLDNCEHLVEAAGEAAESLLAAAPDLRILATSRIPLGLAPETRYPVPPLGNAAAAVQLFRDRAAAMNRLPGDGDQALIEEVCAHLDGMPLAIELAAASTRALSLEEIRRRLGQALDLFRSPLRTTPDRQRSLRGAIAWSFDLLEPAERELFPRLAVFSGGWTLEAAEGICFGDGLPAGAIPATLTILVDHSLVEFAADSGRYRMLEPVREFAAELLGEAPELRRRHAEWFTAWIESAPARLGDGWSWSATVRADDSNLSQAVRWLAEVSEDTELALQLIGAAAPMWGASREATLRFELAQPIVQSAAARRYPQLRARALVRLAWVGASGTRVQLERLHLIREALEETANEPEYVPFRVRYAQMLAWFGQVDEARDILEQTLEQAREEEAPEVVLNCLFGLAHVGQHTRDWDLHQASAREALRIAEGRRLTGDRRFALGVLADGFLHQGRATEAEAIFERLAAEGLDNWPSASEAVMWGNSIMLQGRFAAALTRYRAALRIALAEGDSYHVTLSILCCGLALGLASDPIQGMRLAAWGIARVESQGLSMFPAEREQIAFGSKLVTARLSDAEGQAAVTAGQALSLDEAIDLAFFDREPEAPPPRSRAKLPANLTEREAEILRLLCEGCTNREIAGRLVLSVRTVETHIFNVYTKTNTGGRAAATAWAIANGIYQPPR